MSSRGPVAKRPAAKKPPSNDAAVVREFGAVVNMSTAVLEKWLATRDSHVVGAKGGQTGTAVGGPESVGHRSGRRIVRLLGKDRAALTPGDLAHMRKVIGYVHRHLAQRPAGEAIRTSRWRYSLMNWGHDPLKR
jgi:hypothetical protein